MHKTLMYIILVLLTSCAYPKVGHTPTLDNLTKEIKKFEQEVFSVISDTGLGSGVPIIYNDESYILTCYHVVDRMYNKPFPIVFANSENELSIGFVKYIDPRRDLALISPDDSSYFTKWHSITGYIGERGEDVYHIGWTQWQKGEIAHGRLLNYHYDNNYVKRGIILCDVIPGASGGAVFNNKGDVLGIITHHVMFKWGIFVSSEEILDFLDNKEDFFNPYYRIIETRQTFRKSDWLFIEEANNL